MEPENTPVENEETAAAPASRLHQVTPVSKYLAMALFIILPFVGGYVGYQLAGDRIFEDEERVVKEVPYDGMELDEKNSSGNSKIFVEVSPEVGSISSGVLKLLKEKDFMYPFLYVRSGNDNGVYQISSSKTNHGPMVLYVYDAKTDVLTLLGSVAGNGTIFEWTDSGYRYKLIPENDNRICPDDGQCYVEDLSKEPWIEVEKKEVKTVDQKDLSWRIETAISLIDNKYTRVVATHLGLSFPDFIMYAQDTGFSMWGRILSEEEVTLLVICDRCSHAPSGYLVFDESTGEVVNSLDWDGVPFDDAKQWFRFNQFSTDPSNTLLVTVSSTEVKVFDYAANRTEVLYTENSPEITLCGDIGMTCDSDFIVTSEGEIGFGRYDIATRPGRLIDMKIVQIPDTFK